MLVADIIAPAAIRYGPLVERLTDVDVAVVVRDLVVNADGESLGELLGSTPSSSRSTARCPSLADHLGALYSSWQFHHWYGGVCGYPSGESSHSSWRPSAVMSR